MGHVIPVVPQPEPTEATGYDFQHDVYERGEDAIRQLAGQAPLRTWPGKNIKPQTVAIEKVTGEMLRKYAYWTRAMPALYAAYGGYCAYHARYVKRIDNPTTDHFMALKSGTGNLPALMLAYTWSNYRLAGLQINAIKAALSDVLDPFEIGEGWFALNLGNFKTVVGPQAPEDQVEAIQTTITRLHLDRGVIVESRRQMAQEYWAPPTGKPPLPFWYLEQKEPFLARELRRQGRIRPGDDEP